MLFPIAMSFCVGFGFNALVDARIAGLDKALWDFVWSGATDAAPIYSREDEVW